MITFYLYLFVYLFVLEKGEGREKERKRNISWLPFVCTPSGDGTHTIGTCPDQESNRLPFTLQHVIQLSHAGQGKVVLVLNGNQSGARFLSPEVHVICGLRD